jgi:uncharacterized protein with von Willebrand factor type A (vWA) domain
MERKLVEFAALLRNHGLPVSPPELADAVHAISTIGYAHRQAFHDALACTLAKSLTDRLTFETCFEKFFQFESDPSLHSAPFSATPMLPPQSGQGAIGAGGSGGAGSGEFDTSPSALGEQLLSSDQRQLAIAMARAIETAQLRNIRVITQKGLYGRRILQAMGVDDLERELHALDVNASTVARQRAEALRYARQRLRYQVRDTVERYFQLAREQNRDAILSQTDFSALRESEDIKHVVRHMAKRLITLHRRRQKLAARGLLDVKATLRHNIAHDGILAEPQWKRIRKDKPRVMAVCDVSRSVSQHARFLLMFLYSLQEVIPQLRAFAFSSSLSEVSDYFRQQSLEHAIDCVMERHGMGSTDYGRAFSDLEELTRHTLDRRTTLIILGDARNNNGKTNAHLLHQFHQRAKQVIWLNPESRQRWGSGDSEMIRYQAACTQTWSCRNLSDLERIVDTLLKSA